MSYVNVTRSRSTTLVITPSTGTAITPAHPKSIKGITYEREVIEFSSMTLDQIRRITGEKKFEMIVITILYFKTEMTALKTVWDNNYRCSTAIGKPLDVASTASTSSTLTITGQIAKLVESDVGDEGNKEPDTIEITIATDEITRA
jgi:hypothetical protein